MYCPNCGYECDDLINYCPNCGALINNLEDEDIFDKELNSKSPKKDSYSKCAKNAYGNYNNCNYKQQNISTNPDGSFGKISLTLAIIGIFFPFINIFLFTISLILGIKAKGTESAKYGKIGATISTVFLILIVLFIVFFIITLLESGAL
jgi:hypothetical protein